MVKEALSYSAEECSGSREGCCDSRSVCVLSCCGRGIQLSAARLGGGWLCAALPREGGRPVAGSRGGRVSCGQVGARVDAEAAPMRRRASSWISPRYSSCASEASLTVMEQDADLAAHGRLDACARPARR